MLYSIFSKKKRDTLLLLFFFLLFFGSFFGIFWSFYTKNAVVEPAKGGQILEGMVGTISPSYNFNPLFASGVEKDASRLIFSGLMRYDPERGEIIDDMATHTLSDDKKTYEFALKENVMWHDGQPVIANDILFTYRDIIQNDAFPVTLIKNAFRDVKIEKVDEKTVRFTIPEKRKTFFTNFTLGILPRHQLIGTPVEELIHHSFNQNPIGSGPYRFEEVFQEPDGTSIRFSAFPEYFNGEPKIENITFSVYPTIEQLIKHISEFDALRPMQTRQVATLPKTPHFQQIDFITPRYLAVFFNLKDETLTTKEIRQAMRAAVDTNALAEEFYGERIDTPLVELWPQNDIINISRERAEELLRASGYYFPEEREEESVEENTSGESEENTKETTTEEGEGSLENASEKGNEEEAPASEEESVTEAPSSEEKAEKTPSSPEPEETSSQEEEKDTSSEEVSSEEIGKQSARYVYKPSREKVSTTTDTDFYIIGSFPENTETVSVNGYRLKLFSPKNKRFSYHASTQLKTLTYGENTYTIEFFDASGKRIDTETITITLLSPTAKSSFFFPQAYAEEDTKNLPRYRTNEKGEHIHLALTYLKTFPYLGKLAEDLQKYWEAIGIEIILYPVGPDELRRAIETNDYELLLLPEYLGYNLDPYPYFHLSQAKEGGFNVSKWKNLKASLLLEAIRSTHKKEERLDSLSQLRDIMVDEVPAIFLFTPKYSWLYDAKVKNVWVNTLADLSDRYSRVNEFYIREHRTFSQGEDAEGFFSWFLHNTKEIFSFFFS